MMTIERKDVLKTLVIIWFAAATVYVGWDIWSDYALKGIQQAYQTGYATSVGDFLKKIEESDCQPFEVRKDENVKAQVINAQCLEQPQSTQQPVQAQPGAQKK